MSNPQAQQCAWSQTVTVAITGASGAQYGLRLLQALVAANCRVYVLLSSAALIVIRTETDFAISDDEQEQLAQLQQLTGAKSGLTVLMSKMDCLAPVASGSSSSAQMVICPASGGTLSAVACGASNNLIERAADVALKERRKLILVPRETPYSDIHLENMLKLSRMGAVILPASPGFYQKPAGINDLVDFIVARIMDQLGIPQTLLAPWGE